MLVNILFSECLNFCETVNDYSFFILSSRYPYLSPRLNCTAFKYSCTVSMKSALRKVRHLLSRNTRSTERSDPSNAEDNSEVTPISCFHLNTESDYCVQVELLPPGQLIRIFGVDTSSSCLDFTLKLSLLLGLQPGSHLLMVPNLNFSRLSGDVKRGLVSHVWQRAPSNSRLQDWLKPLSDADTDSTVEEAVGTQSQCSILGSLRLVHRTCVRNAARSGLLETHLQNGSKDMRFEGKGVTKSGRELLDEIGARVLVHLPRDRKIVIRANLSRPIFESVVEVCTLRSLTPGHHSLRNPHTGCLLDPLLSFRAQHTMEFELRECDPVDSNLACLVSTNNLNKWSPVDASEGLCLVIKPREFSLGGLTSSSNNSRSTNTFRGPPVVPSSSGGCSISNPSNAFRQDASSHRIGDTSLSIPVHTQSTNFSNPKIRKKRKAPPPPSVSVTQPAMNHLLLNRSMQNLCCSSFNVPPSKSSSFVQVNCADDQDETEKRNLTHLAALSANSKASSVGFSSAYDERPIIQPPNTCIKAHTLPRTSKVSFVKSGQPVSSLAQKKGNVVSEWELTKVVRLCPTHLMDDNNDENQDTPVSDGACPSPAQMRDVNFQISRPNSNPDTVELLVSNSQTCYDDASASPSAAESNDESGVLSHTSNTLEDNLIPTDPVHKISLSQDISSAPKQDKIGPIVAQRPSKAVVSNYMWKRCASPFKKFDCPSKATSSSGPQGPMTPLCFIAELNEAVSKVRAAKMEH